MILRLLVLLALPVLAYYLSISVSRRFSLTQRQNRILFFITAALLVIGVLVVMGRLPAHYILAPVGAAGAFMLRFLPTILRLLPFWHMFRSRVASGSGPSTNQASSIRTEYFEMRLEHSNGNLDGDIRKGSHAGRKVSDLTLSELLALRQECAGEHDSLQVLEAYLDRMHEGWREQAGVESESGGADADDEDSMDRRLALEILGLEGHPDKDEIVRAHRGLMQKLHPDRGGSSYLAQKINRAREVLLKEFE